MQLRHTSAALLGVVVTAVAGMATYALTPPSTHYAHASYIFDVQDQRQVAGWADHVVVASVISPGSSEVTGNAPPQTTYLVRIESVLKGSLDKGRTVRIHQTGVDVSGKQITLLEGVEPVHESHTYIFALKPSDSDLLGVVSVPDFSPQLIALESSLSPPDSRAIADWRLAITDQLWPPNLPR